MESEKLEKILAPFKMLDLRSHSHHHEKADEANDDQELNITMNKSIGRRRHDSLLLTKPKQQSKCDDEEIGAHLHRPELGEFQSKFNDNVQLPRSRYKIDGQESELIDVEEGVGSVGLVTSSSADHSTTHRSHHSSLLESGKRITEITASSPLSLESGSKKTRMKKFFNIFKINSN